MAAVLRDHYRYFSLARLVSEIVFSREFSGLYDELLSIYKEDELDNAEKEAFQDSLYSHLVQRRTMLYSSSFVRQSLAYENHNN